LILRTNPVSGFTLKDRFPRNVLTEVTTLDLSRDPVINLGGTM
jgi:hypothetical protein